jgi:selenide,water dikinase
MRPSQAVLRDIVLVGGGHSHVGVLRQFGMKPEPGVRLTLISATLDTPYSGMLPGYVAGHYSFEQVHIDLPRLAAWAGARFIHDEAVGLDLAAGRVLLADRPSMAFDLCAINVGSTPNRAGVSGAAEHAVPVKPIPQFNARWLALLQRVRAQPGALSIAVVGGGAGGVELCLAMQHRLRHERQAAGGDPESLSFHLFTQSAQVLPTHNAWVQRRFVQVLAERGVVLHLEAPVTQVTAQGLWASSPKGPAQLWPADEVVWVTQAGGPAWLQGSGLLLDAQGFVSVNASLQASDPRVFASGDVASFTDRPLEKAGVFAVRMGQPLADNLRRQARGGPLLTWRPQRRWLALISTGDRHAVASRGAIGFAGDWVWRWKDAIDQRFMRRFNSWPAQPMALPVQHESAPPVALSPAERVQHHAAQAMRCGGCGAKVGASLLHRAMADVLGAGDARRAQHPDVLIGLDAPDDAAVVRVPRGQALVHSIDFFRAFIDDPYLFGQIAANHALGDLYAMGARPHTATAVLTVRPGLDSKVQEQIRQLMTGALRVLEAADCALVGGHSAEGQELAMGFAVTGLVSADLVGLMRKTGLQAGDALVLTKPLGTGVLMAAQAMAAQVPGFRGAWVVQALQAMCHSNQDAAQVLAQHGAVACTDVTGFGLAGHLVEMLQASKPALLAELDLQALPLLAGAQHCAAAGVVSSLFDANRQWAQALLEDAAGAEPARQALLFDPQTAGGLLAGVPAHRVPACMAALAQAGYGQASVIGWVKLKGEGDGDGARDPLLRLLPAQAPDGEAS